MLGEATDRRRGAHSERIARVQTSERCGVAAQQAATAATEVGWQIQQRRGTVDIEPQGTQ